MFWQVKKTREQLKQEWEEKKNQRAFKHSFNVLSTELFLTIKQLKMDENQNSLLKKINEEIKNASSPIDLNLDEEQTLRLNDADTLSSCARLFYLSAKNLVKEGKFNQEQQKIILKTVTNAKEFLSALSANSINSDHLNEMRKSVDNLTTLHNETLSAFAAEKNKCPSLPFYLKGLSVLLGAALVCVGVVLAPFNVTAGLSVAIPGAGLVALGAGLIAAAKKKDNNALKQASEMTLAAINKLIAPFNKNPPAVKRL